jgi:hypothetical protein
MRWFLHLCVPVMARTIPITVLVMFPCYCETALCKSQGGNTLQRSIRPETQEGHTPVSPVGDLAQTPLKTGEQRNQDSQLLHGHTDGLKIIAGPLTPVAMRRPTATLYSSATDPPMVHGSCAILRTLTHRKQCPRPHSRLPSIGETTLTEARGYVATSSCGADANGELSP